MRLLNKHLRDGLPGRRGLLTASARVLRQRRAWHTQATARRPRGPVWTKRGWEEMSLERREGRLTVRASAFPLCEVRTHG